MYHVGADATKAGVIKIIFKMGHLNNIHNYE